MLVAWAGLRGAASIVFAIYAVVSSAYTRTDIFHVVFCVALLSVSFQGTLLPILARKFDLVDNTDTVFKTFTDYQGLSEVQLFDIHVGKEHPWVQRHLRDIGLPSDMLAVAVQRQGKMLVPRGNTLIRTGDALVITGGNCQDDRDAQLKEIRISRQHPWLGKKVGQLSWPDNACLVMIRREEGTVLPRADTLLRAGDTLVLRGAVQPPKEVRAWKLPRWSRKSKKK